MNGLEAAVGLAQMQMHVFETAESGSLLTQDRADPELLVTVDFNKLMGLVPGSDMPFVRELYEVNARVSLVLSVQFQCERMMADLLRASGDGITTFEGAAKQLLLNAEVSSPVRKASWMYLPSLIRNTLHNGGFHGRRNRQITLGDTTYVFKSDRRFEQAGWHHITHALSAELDVLEELLTTPLVTDLGVVPDRFAFLGFKGYPPRRLTYPVAGTQGLPG